MLPGPLVATSYCSRSSSTSMTLGNHRGAEGVILLLLVLLLPLPHGPWQQPTLPPPAISDQGFQGSPTIPREKWSPGTNPSLGNGRHQHGTNYLCFRIFKAYPFHKIFMTLKRGLVRSDLSGLTVVNGIFSS